MEFPFGHHRHHHSRPESDPNQDPYANPNPSPYPDPNQYPPPSHNPYAPPPSQDYYPPPPSVQHVSHEQGRPDFGHVSHEYGRPAYEHVSHEYGRPAYENVSQEYGRPAYGHATSVQHVGHEVGGGGGGYYGNEMPSGGGGFPPVAHVGHVSHETGSHARPAGGELSRQPTVRIYTKADENYSLSIRDGNVVLVPTNPRDEYQHWIKDLKYSTRVKDAEGLPSFALINKVTGEAIKHAVKETCPVRLIRYNPDYLDESVLWTESKDTGEGFRCIRMVNNIGLNFDAFNGDDDHGGVRDGTPVVLWEWLEGKNQRWKIVPYSG